MTRNQRFTQVDAFTDRAFAGNPAAVCLLSSAGDDAWMQQVAREMNLAETAFLVRPRGDPRVSGPDRVRLSGGAGIGSGGAVPEP